MPDLGKLTNRCRTFRVMDKLEFYLMLLLLECFRLDYTDAAHKCVLVGSHSTSLTAFLGRNPVLAPLH